MSHLHLAFELSENQASVARIESGNVTILDHFFFEGKKDFQYKERLSLCLEKLNLNNQTPDEITVSWIDAHATLIPISVFKPELLDSYFQASFTKKVQHNDIDYNRIFSHSLVNVYEIPLWVKSFFVTKYPRVLIFHLYSHIIKASSESPSKMAEISCIIYPDLLVLCLSKGGNIIYCNSFETTQQEDLLYYLSFVIQQNEQFAKANVELCLSQAVQFTDEATLKKEFARISLLQNLTVNFNPKYSFKIQEFCV